MSITRAQLHTLRNEMEAAFENANITGFTLDVGSMRFGENEVTIKVLGKVTGAVTTSDALFNQKVAEYGLRLVGNKGQTLTSFNKSRPKFPFSYKTVRGARYKATVEQAKSIFG